MTLALIAAAVTPEVEACLEREFGWQIVKLADIRSAIPLDGADVDPGAVEALVVEAQPVTAETFAAMPRPRQVLVPSSMDPPCIQKLSGVADRRESSAMNVTARSILGDCAACDSCARSIVVAGSRRRQSVTRAILDKCDTPLVKLNAEPGDVSTAPLG